VCHAAGLAYLPVGGAWLIAARLRLNPLGFGDTIVLLTAAHFHFAGFAAPLLAGRTGHQLAQTRPALLGLFRPPAAGLVLGVPLVAAGITLSRPLELAAVLLLAASMVGLATLVLLAIVPASRPWHAGALLAISALAVLASMLLACAYAAGPWLGMTIITIPQMVLLHGWANGLGFAVCGLLGWTLLETP
jgi:hypothetical protein